MTKTVKKFKALTQHFKDGHVGYIRVGGVLYQAIPISARSQVYLGAMVIFRRYGNIIKDVGLVDGINIKDRDRDEQYTINSIPQNGSSHVWCCRHMSYTDITHILSTFTR